MLQFLHDCSLPRQNRILDVGKRSLYTMSMSELYALSVVAEFAFRKATEAIAGTGDEVCAEISDKCWQAIDLVGSCSRLIAKF